MSNFEGSEAELFEDGRTALRTLDEASRLTAEVIIDLQDKGALYAYVMEKREEAAKAMLALADANPTDTATIIELQATIRPYRDACAWIHRKLDEGEEIAEQINQENTSDESYPD